MIFHSCNLGRVGKWVWRTWDKKSRQASLATAERRVPSNGDPTIPPPVKTKPGQQRRRGKDDKMQNKQTPQGAQATPNAAAPVKDRRGRKGKDESFICQEKEERKERREKQKRPNWLYARAKPPRGGSLERPHEQKDGLASSSVVEFTLGGTVEITGLNLD